MDLLNGPKQEEPKDSIRMKAKNIINRLIWIDAKVNNKENNSYQKILKNDYKLKIEVYETAEEGIKALEGIQFESIFVITSGTIYPEFFNYMKRTYDELRVIPFSIIFTSNRNNFIEKHKNDAIGKLYNKTFFNRGGVVDNFNGVISFINEIYYNLNAFKTKNKYDKIFTKNYSGLTVFREVTNQLSLPQFFEDIYNNRNIDFSELNNFTKFFLVNFCTPSIEKLLKPLILFKEVPEVIISKYWARIYTHETPFYSIMNKSLMNNYYKEYEIYIKLLYRGLACNSFLPKFGDNLARGTKLELSEINYLKSIAYTNRIIVNKNFLSFSLNVQKSIEFQDNCKRDPSLGDYYTNEEEEDYINEEEDYINEEEDNIRVKEDNLSVLIIIQNIEECNKNNYMISNAYLKDISCYSKEEEVLIFPFTGFEVIGWENSRFLKGDNEIVEGTTFYFKFSQKYYEKIKANYS